MKPFQLLLICFVFLNHFASAAETKPTNNFDVLVFSKTIGYRHASITNGIAAIKKLGAENQFAVDATEDSSAFTSENLSKYKAVIFLNTIGDILDEPQQNALQKFVESGGGFVGIHAAIPGDVATEANWPWYGELLCTQFTNHSKIVEGTVQVEDAKHPSTAHLPARWTRKDEWYNFTINPRPKVRVLATLDESSFTGGTMGKDHPIAWWKKIEKGRVWYTALGHTDESFREPEFLKHILGGIQFVAK